MMRYFHVADVDDLCEVGFTLLRTDVGARRDRAVALRLLIDVPTPFRRMFDVDYGRYQALRRVRCWLRVELGWVRGHRWRFARGVRAGDA